MVQHLLVYSGAYHDSVTLMLASREAETGERVAFATAVMGTPLNLELLEKQNFHFPAESRPGPNDLVFAVSADNDEAATAALEVIEAQLAAPRAHSTNARATTPRSLRVVSRARPGLNLAFLSVPGRHVAYEIAESLNAGLHVFCFSEGLDLATEALLKQQALERGLLLLGPDCGTAIVDGVALGFANAVRRGPIGIVGASGTGIQEVSCLLDAGGVGISHAIGVGGRDLSLEVGGLMTMRALRLLADDPTTDAIIVVSKPPSPHVAAAVAREAAATGKPAVLALLGIGDEKVEGVAVASTLEHAARAAATLVGAELPPEDGASPPAVTRGVIRGLFSGGTLCYEAMALVSAAIGQVASNIPLRPEWRLEDVHRSRGHTFIDFGDDTLTEGRAHPMIDYRLRTQRLGAEAADPDVGVILLDVVLGFGVNANPAAELEPTIERALEQRHGTLSIVVAMCGAAADPQGLDAQARLLERAGALVTRGNANGARLALRAAGLRADR